MTNKKVVLITGGSRGIGSAIAEVFASNQYAVVINYSASHDAAEALKGRLSKDNDAVSLERADVSDYAQVESMIAGVMEKYGRLDVLVNNAGITRDGFLMLMSQKDWQDVVDINLTGVFNCSKAVTQHMIGQRSGVIINVSSLSGITGLAGQTNYAASKGGMIAFTKALAKELARFGIRVNAVAPGVISTEIVDSLGENVRKQFMENIPMKRFGRPSEVASVVKFLASDDASYITGETICITGGLY
jgi:3-oxoacyl-[acyl-carrier protein] reductase